MIQLSPYQIDAIKRTKTGCILCGGVGSGKSLTSLGYYYTFNGGFINKNGEMGSRMFCPQDLVIITTAKKRDSHEWELELMNIYMNPDPKINSYNNTVIIDSWNNIGKYVNFKKAFFIFDEQRVVGKGAWTKAFYKICKANNWILLSATPGDTWSDYIPVFIANGFYKNRSQFNDEHVVWNAHVNYPSIERYLGTKKLERLREEILITMDYVHDIEQEHIYLEAGYDHLLYKQVCKTRADPFETWEIDGIEYPRPLENAAEFCHMLRKIVNSDPSRIDLVQSVMKTHPKAIIFYNFDFELDILRNIQYPEGTVVAEWNGKKHELVPKGEKWVYLVQYNAGSEGWNCIRTDTMIFFSESYSYKQMVQAAGRIDRRNTPFKKLLYYHIRSCSNIDLAIRRSLSEKKEFNKSAFYKKHLPAQK